MSFEIMLTFTKRVPVSRILRQVQGIATSPYHYRAFHVSAKRQGAAPQFVVDAVRRHKENGVISLWELSKQNTLGADWKTKLNPQDAKRMKEMDTKQRRCITRSIEESGEDCVDGGKAVELCLRLLSRDVARLKSLEIHIKEREERLARARAGERPAEGIEVIEDRIRRRQGVVSKIEGTLTDLFGEEWRTVDPADLPEPRLSSRYYRP